ncbi:MAG: hypothetical protein C4539_06230 [Ignavibacteriales bacterium]|nr:MAG: hypothetical protein C4539_06230 [Ignavibacteriales bacterium]
MLSISKPPERLINEDFATEITNRATIADPPSEEVIYFRNWHLIRRKSPIKIVPVELLRYRKDNGRIASDVLSYEKMHGILIEKSEETQKILKKFLDEKDVEKTTELMNSIRHASQRDPAIITSDGFLINGNRRKLALERLFEETKDERFKWMRVVILPGKDDVENGGAPTIYEIEQIENRYQFQSEGKAEYYSFDKALSMRKKIDHGMLLEEQLKDDPNFAHLEQNEFQKVVKKYREDYLEPLRCIDKYLESLGRTALYDTISSGITDKEGRWQAFLDYYNLVEKKLLDKDKLYELGLKEDQVGVVRDVAFKIIRKREFKDLPKVHMIMRKLPQILKNPEAREEILKLKKIKMELQSEKIIEDGKEIDERKKDNIWASDNAVELQHHVAKALHLITYQEEKEKPIDLLKSALQKLTHKDLKAANIESSDLKEARKIALEIEDTANKLAKEFFDWEKLSNRHKIIHDKKKKYK